MNTSCVLKNRISASLLFLGAVASVGLLPVYAIAQTPAATAPVDVTFNVSRFVVEGDNPLGEARAQQILRPYLGVQHGMDGLENATRAIEAALKQRGYALYRVVLPTQEAVDAITLRIIKFPVVEINVRGQKFFGEANIRASVPALSVGDTPDMRQVARQLALANDNPAKKTDVQLEESEDGAGIKATLSTTDLNPYSATVGFNNTGTDTTGGRSRVMTYLQDANFMGNDQVVGLAYTTSPNASEKIKQYGLFYRAPVYALGGVLSASYSYSSVASGSLGNGTTVTGAGTTGGLSYTHYFFADGNYKSSLALGLDDKLFRSPVIGGVRGPEDDVRSMPLSLTYVGSYSDQGTSMNYTLEYDHNLTIGADNTNPAYASNRVGASRNWETYRLSYGMTAVLWSGWALNVAMHAQYSPDPLISGEQFGIGGASSVRGIDERLITGDTGLTSSLEVYTPELVTNTRALAFYDSGFITRSDVQPGELAHDGLQSLGLGLRYTLGQSAQVSVDYGYVVHGTASNLAPTGTSRVHANLLYRF